MLSNMILFAVNGDAPEFDAMAERMAQATFVPCTPTQASSFGWAPPRSIDGGET